MGKSFQEHVNSADIIFYGTVTSINDEKYENYENTLTYLLDSASYPENYGYKPTFKIIEIFKGTFEIPLEHNSYEYKSRWSNCDRSFKKGYSYIVFGYFEENGEINTSICLPGGIIYDSGYFPKLRTAVVTAIN